MKQPYTQAEVEYIAKRFVEEEGRITTRQLADEVSKKAETDSDFNFRSSASIQYKLTHIKNKQREISMNEVHRPLLQSNNVSMTPKEEVAVLDGVIRAIAGVDDDEFDFDDLLEEEASQQVIGG